MAAPGGLPWEEGVATLIKTGASPMTDKAISPLRQRMIEDMTIRKLAPKTQHDYVQRVKHFAAFLGRSPDTASLPVRVLSRLFRRLLLERLLAAHKAGRLKFFGGHA